MYECATTGVIMQLRAWKVRVTGAAIGKVWQFLDKHLPGQAPSNDATATGMGAATTEARCEHKCWIFEILKYMAWVVKLYGMR